ncbi:hypothetical protein PENTCL1PPCAC_27652, partial [Pristionchus entomophagus]
SSSPFLHSSLQMSSSKEYRRRRRRRPLWERLWPSPRSLWTTVLLLTVISLPAVESGCVDGEVCSESDAKVCRNGTCVSACSLRGMQPCECDAEEDNYCYLCCGNARHQCAPADQHGILRSNGERWEREACTRCRTNGQELEGLPCDDADPNRLCLGGKCSNSVCHAKQPGSFCDRKMEKICTEDQCENPCARFAPHLMVCECAPIDPDTGFASEDRCQLCCYDFNLKPTNRRCRNAFRNYKVMTSAHRPIWRVGLECAGGKTCNRFGVCSSSGVSIFSALLLVLMTYLAR